MTQSKHVTRYSTAGRRVAAERPKWETMAYMTPSMRAAYVRDTSKTGSVTLMDTNDPAARPLLPAHLLDRAVMLRYSSERVSARMSYAVPTDVDDLDIQVAEDVPPPAQPEPVIVLQSPQEVANTHGNVGTLVATELAGGGIVAVEEPFNIYEDPGPMQRDEAVQAAERTLRNLIHAGAGAAQAEERPAMPRDMYPQDTILEERTDPHARLIRAIEHMRSTAPTAYYEDPADRIRVTVGRAEAAIQNTTDPDDHVRLVQDRLYQPLSLDAHILAIVNGDNTGTPNYVVAVLVLLQALKRDLDITSDTSIMGAATPETVRIKNLLEDYVLNATVRINRTIRRATT